MLRYMPPRRPSPPPPPPFSPFSLLSSHHSKPPVPSTPPQPHPPHSSTYTPPSPPQFSNHETCPQHSHTPPQSYNSQTRSCSLQSKHAHARALREMLFQVGHRDSGGEFADSQRVARVFPGGADAGAGAWGMLVSRSGCRKWQQDGEEGEEGYLTSATTTPIIRPTNTQLPTRPPTRLPRATSMLPRELPLKHCRLPRKQRLMLVVEKPRHLLLLRREDPRIALLRHPHAAGERLHMRPGPGTYIPWNCCANCGAYCWLGCC